MNLTPRHRTLARRLAFIVGTPVLVAVAALAGPYAWVHLTARPHVYTVATAPTKPTALLLGAGLNADGTPSAYLQARLDVGAQLFRRGKVKALLVSGDNRYKNYNEPDAMRDALIRDGIPASAIVEDYAGRDTYDSCYRARHIFGATSLIVVGQSYHLSRAITLCRSVGLDAAGVGDSSVKKYSDVWQSGELREIPANGKAVLDVVTRREPVMGPQEEGLRRIVGTP